RRRKQVGRGEHLSIAERGVEQRRDCHAEKPRDSPHSDHDRASCSGKPMPVAATRRTSSFWSTALLVDARSCHLGDRGRSGAAGGRRQSVGGSVWESNNYETSAFLRKFTVFACSVDSV